jgi:hypothetical protein
MLIPHLVDFIQGFSYTALQHKYISRNHYTFLLVGAHEGPTITARLKGETHE